MKRLSPPVSPTLPNASSKRANVCQDGDRNSAASYARPHAPWSSAQATMASSSSGTRYPPSAAMAGPSSASNSGSGSASASAPSSSSSAAASLGNTLSTPPLSAPLRTPLFQKPACIATFSYDDERGLHHDNRSLGIFHPPPGPTFDRNADRGRGQMRGPDLNYGFERWRRRDETVDEHLDSLLIALQHKATAAASIDADRDRARADVITWRGIATKLCTAIFAENSYDNWELNVMQVGHTLYLEEFVSPSSRKQKAASMEPRLLGFMYQGYAFESFCTSPAVPVPEPNAASASSEPRPKTSTAGDPPGWGGTVNNNVQWCAICKTTLGSNRLIIGGEVDCIQSSARSKFSSNTDLLRASSLDPDDFVELKTSAEIRGARDAERFEGTKMIRFYMQSFLLGVPTLVCGFRDRSGYLVDVQHFNTLQLPRTVRARNPLLDAGKGLAFADQILGWVRTHIATDSHNTSLSPPPLQDAEKSYPVFRISFAPLGHSGPPSRDPNNYGGVLTIRRLSDAEVVSEVKGGAEGGRVGFLLSSYYSFAREKLAVR
ncbi:decapping endonuclease targeting mRNA [Tilletia horrida]|nr:decapping endonuclease targeting mRNA [Tilletia horrida]KAK0555477.1 decapping endonuclease targeting mRNA [Tilletia horrida]